MRDSTDLFMAWLTLLRAHYLTMAATIRWVCVFFYFPFLFLVLMPTSPSPAGVIKDIQVRFPLDNPYKRSRTRPPRFFPN